MARPRKYNCAIEAMEARRVQKRTWEAKNRDKRTVQKRVLRHLKPLERTQLVKPPYIQPVNPFPFAIPPISRTMDVQSQAPETAVQRPDPGHLPRKASRAQRDAFMAASIENWPSPDHSVRDIWAYAQTVLSIWLDQLGSVFGFCTDVWGDITTEDLDLDGLHEVMRLIQRFSEKVDESAELAVKEMGTADGDEVAEKFAKLAADSWHIESCLWQFFNILRDDGHFYLTLEGLKKKLKYQQSAVYVPRAIYPDEDSESDEEQQANQVVKPDAYLDVDWSSDEERHGTHPFADVEAEEAAAAEEAERDADEEDD
ncbi:hypothetical protein BD410DRAFT_846562 [Rickenella mellea]|uniref:Pre-rRNA-processing protein TSR2 n=1 Tax=Rickenella mellea TaxID=50990 RepID=A0A4Y7PES3_9AGAM|nr:hypothetical protein BD410DRAFT_846562 [Rickenella mellea]